MYLTYSEYVEMGGSHDETAYKHIEYRARQRIDSKTFARLKKVDEIPESVKMLMYELITLDYSRISSSSPGQVASESNDGYSVTYRAAETQDEYEDKVNNLIWNYLINEIVNGTPLLYLGVR